jgi:hypothetical protein
MCADVGKNENAVLTREDLHFNSNNNLGFFNVSGTLRINIRSCAVLQKMLLRHFRYIIYGVDNMQDILYGNVLIAAIPLCI